MAVAPTLERTESERGEAAGQVGLGARVEKAVGLLASVVDELDPDRLTGTDATTLYGSLAGAERLAQAGKALLGPRIELSGTWKESGHRDAASLLAEVEGVSPGEARRTLELGRRLPSLPGTEEAMRRGELSRPKLTELAGAAIVDPGKEADLLEGAEREPLAEVRERCRQVRATAAGADPVATVAAIHARRHFTSWTDAEGAFCYQGRDTADRGARMLAQLGPMATALRRARRKAGVEGEPECALRADALFALVTRRDGPARTEVDPDTGEPVGDVAGEETGGVGEARPPTDAGVSGEETTDPSGHPPVDPDARAIVERPPPATVIVRVDLDVLLRGQIGPEGVSEMVGAGPIPVAMARDLANDAFLALCFHR